MNMEKYLEPTYLCPSDSDKIKQLAKEIISTGQFDEGKAKSLFKWVRDNYTWKIRKIVGAEGILERKENEAICIDKTNLLIAFCRASDIPARYLILKCDIQNKISDEPDTIRHAAAEIYLDEEWIIADPAFGVGTEEFIEVSKFGEKTWLKEHSKERSESLPRYMPIFFNCLLYYVHPSLRDLKERLDKV